MMSSQSIDFQHDHPEKAGVLLMNLGTPDAPKAADVRRYLAQFLSDRRVVDLPSFIWKPVLHGVILRIRPAPVAKKYASVWMEQGSPLWVHTRNLAEAVAEKIKRNGMSEVMVETAMCYGNPSCAAALQRLKEAGMRRLLVIPLYPQYSATTTAAAFDAIAAQMKKMRWMPDLRFVSHYHKHESYIQALTASVRHHWQQHGRPDQLVMSFHGIPQRYFDSGDPYHCECHATARLLAEALDLSEDEYKVTFQSRFGREPWLQPYTDHTLEALAKQGLEHIQIICPGFSADCLETLEEIDQENREIFTQAGGQTFSYIPALNAHPDHVEMVVKLISENSSGWAEFEPEYDVKKIRSEALACVQRAQAKGAAG